MNHYLCRSLLLAGITLLISSCESLAPHAKKPVIDMPSRWHSRDKHAAAQPVQINALAWWKKFHDPQLNQLMTEALLNNNDLGVATGNIFAAQAALRKVQYSWLPSIGLGGAGFAGQFPDRKFVGPQLPIPQLPFNHSPRVNGYFAGFVPEYSLNILKNIKQGNVARLNLAMQSAEQNATRLGVISQVAGSYLSLLGLKKQLALQDQMIHDATALRDLTTVQYQQGSVSTTNVIAVDQLIASLRKKRPIIQHDITKVENALNVLTNKNPGAIITKNHFDRIHTQGVIPINLPSETLKARPDVAIAEYQLEISHAMVGVAASELFPSFSLTGLGGASTIDLTSILSWGSGLGAGVAVAKMPLISMEVFAGIAQAKGKKYAAYHNYIKTVRNAFAEVDNALSQHASIDQSYDQQYIAAQKAKEQYHVAKNQYQQGAISYADTLAAKLNFDYMQANLNQAKMQQMRSIVNLYQVFAGGCSSHA